MTDIQLTIVLAAIVPTLAAIGAMVVSIVNAIKGAERGKKAEEDKVELAGAVNDVHSIVNNKADISAQKIEVLQKQVADLLAMAAEKKEEAALLAQAAVRPRQKQRRPAKPKKP